MEAPLPYPVPSIADAVARIDQGEDPWFALGCFLHDWWRYAADHRQDLISEPPGPTATEEGRRWAAFCAAVVEELCFRTSFPCPAWTQRQSYVLERPWYYFPQLSQRDWLLATTPEPFKRRNIFVGGSVLDNKYELHHPTDAKPRWSMWSDQELQNLAVVNRQLPIDKGRDVWMYSKAADQATSASQPGSESASHSELSAEACTLRLS